MAKDEKGGKIRVVVFEMEGNNETLQEGLRALANTLGRSVNPTRLTAPTTAKPLPKGGGKLSSVAEDVEFVEDEEAETEADETKSAPNRAKRNRNYRSPEVLELDLKAGQIPFEAFCQQKNPDSEIGKYLVIATWLKENLKLDAIGVDHIYTCSRIMKWGVAKDMSQTFRGGKRVGYFKSPERGLFAVTHIGIDVVDKMNTGA